MLHKGRNQIEAHQPAGRAVAHVCIAANSLADTEKEPIYENSFFVNGPVRRPGSDSS